MHLFYKMLAMMTLLFAVSVPARADEGRIAVMDLNRLAGGGYTIYLRHARTDATQKDATPVDLSDCDTQRPLSIEGRRQAEAIGKALAGAGIDPQTVFSSPYCRCRQTAEIAFGPERLRVVSQLSYSFRDPKEIREQKAAWLKAQMRQEPAPGKVLVIVSHTSNLMDALGVWPEQEGAALVTRPDGAGHIEIIGRLPPELWDLP